jgi:hypothetical protein
MGGILKRFKVAQQTTVNLEKCRDAMAPLPKDDRQKQQEDLRQLRPFQSPNRINERCRYQCPLGESASQGRSWLETKTFPDPESPSFRCAGG